MNSYSFGKKSRQRQQGVQPGLISVAEHALAYQITDMTMVDDNSGKRTRDMQLVLVGSGVSKTMNSYHLIQPDGYGHAIDLAPYPIDWKDYASFIRVAHCVRCAAIEKGVLITWGAVWDKHLNDLGPNLEAEVEAYANRRRAMGRHAFLDYPHFQYEGLVT